MERRYSGADPGTELFSGAAARTPALVVPNPANAGHLPRRSAPLMGRFHPMNRSLSYANSSRDGTGEGNLVVRRGRHADTHALAILAALDSARPLTGPTVVGEVDGRLVAAISLHDGRVVADPFAPTADVVEILRRHTAGARSAKGRPRRGRFGLVPRRVAPKFA
jgi:hypothetical protein